MTAVFVRAVGRAAAVAFRPAVALTGRFRYAQKFVAVGLVLLVPLRASRCLRRRNNGESPLPRASGTESSSSAR